MNLEMQSQETVTDVATYLLAISRIFTSLEFYLLFTHCLNLRKKDYPCAV